MWTCYSLAACIKDKLIDTLFAGFQPHEPRCDAARTAEHLQYYYILESTQKMRNRCGRATPWRLVSKTSCILICTCVSVHASLLAACIRIKLTDVDALMPGGLYRRQAASKFTYVWMFNSRCLHPESSCVNYAQQMWVRYSPAACIKDKMQFNIHMWECACVTPAGLHQDQAA